MKEPSNGRVRPIIKRFLKLLAVILIAGFGFFGWRVYAASAKITGDKNPLQLLGLFTPSQLSETDGRVNVLVAGYSADDPGHDGADLTDSIMILSIDPTTKSAFVLSIPRDLYVDIPGYGYSKINAAYPDGENGGFNQSGYFNGGMGLLQEVIQNNLGMQLNYYSLINYSAVKDAVNTVGGVMVTINSSDPRGLYDPNTDLYLPNGKVTLNGQTALDLMRARGDGYGSYGFDNGDFDRIKNQQMVLLALKSKVAGMFPNPFKVVSLINAVGDNVQTDMQLNQMETFYYLVKGINNSNIHTYSLQSIKGQSLLSDYTTYDGEDALVPTAGTDDFSHIDSVVQQLN